MIRALKYYVFIMVLVALVIVLLALVGFADLTNINTLFTNGYTAVWEIALIFLAVAFVYPKIGFGSRDFTMRAKDWDEARMNMMIALGDKGYKLESEDGRTFTFRKKWFMNRLAKFLEDRVTITLADTPGKQNPEPESAVSAAGGENRNGVEAGRPADTEEYGENQQPASASGERLEASAPLNKYVVNIEGLTKDIVRIVSALHRVQSQNRDE